MMIVAPVLIEWTFRSSILIMAGALLLRALRAKDPSIRLAAWTAMLGGSLLIPVLAATLPKFPLNLNHLSMRAVPARSPGAPATASQTIAMPMPAARRQTVGLTEPSHSTAERPGVKPSRFEWLTSRWMSGAAVAYLVIAGALLLRVFAGLVMSLRLLRTSCVTGETTEGIEIRQSNRVYAPVTLGILRPAIVLPTDWREWAAAKLEAVVAHERSHVRRRDPALQLLSLIHRALLWHSPLSWFLHQRIVRTAEEVSDDAAVAATRDRVSYAEVLLEFMRHKVPRTGIAMARYGIPEKRIHRILYGTTLTLGVGRWSLAAILSLGSPLAYLVATAQVQPEFEIADVHVSPSREDGRSGVVMEGGAVRGRRYEISNATMVDLIRVAYEVETAAVLGGPNWLASDRFDVIARVPENATRASISVMLQSLLANRFAVVARKEARPMPAWVLSTGAGEPKLKRTDNSGESGCRIAENNDRLSCRNVTMDAFVRWLRARPYTTLPVVNSTGIEGAWDFEVGYTFAGGFGGISETNAENNRILNAFEKQLGLKLELQKVSQPVVLVDSVNRTPTANPLDVETRLPPDPVQFDVAAVRPCQTVDLRAWRSSPSGQLTTGCQPLSMLISRAWNLGSEVQGVGNLIVSTVPANIPGAPGWLNAKRFSIVANAPITVAQAGDAKYRAMLRNLLVDRFKIVTHYEDRPVDAYVLVAAKPKLTRADPSGRSECKSTGLRMGVPTVITCQNVTVGQFAEMLNRQVSVIATGRRIVDETGIQGTWNLTLTYQVRQAAAATPGVAADPSGDISPFDAIEQQLGLKVQEAKRPMPMFVIDHIEENPTEN